MLDAHAPVGAGGGDGKTPAIRRELHRGHVLTRRLPPAEFFGLWDIPKNDFATIPAGGLAAIGAESHRPRTVSRAGQLGPKLAGSGVKNLDQAAIVRQRDGPAIRRKGATQERVAGKPPLFFTGCHLPKAGFVQRRGEQRGAIGTECKAGQSRSVDEPMIAKASDRSGGQRGFDRRNAQREQEHQPGQPLRWCAFCPKTKFAHRNNFITRSGENRTVMCK